jgi:hypothetical protein
LPFLITGLSGFVLGARILDPGAINHAARAALCDIWVMMLAFILQVVRVSIVARSEDAFVVLFLVGMLYVGWLLLIIGAISGWLLYRVSRRVA